MLSRERFPRSNKYAPEWVVASASGGANSLWLAEWLANAIEFRPGMRVLDLGCGKAASSIFLHREFGLDVWAVDLWCNPAENLLRVRDAGVEQHVFPSRSNARSLPFAVEFFDAIVAIDSFMYFGTDDLYLAYLVRFLKPGGYLGIASAGFQKEIDGEIPEHLRKWWTPELWCLHSPDWWRRHWDRSGVVDVEVADAMVEGWRLWLDWHETIAPDNHVEIEAVRSDRGTNLCYLRTVARRGSDVDLEEPLVSLPSAYTKKPLLR